MAGLFSAATFRTIGSAGTPQTIFTIQNGDATKLVYVRRLLIQMDATAVLTAVMPLMKCSRTSDVPSAGTALAKALFDSANASNANTVVRGACSSDAGALSAPAGTPGDIIWQQYCMRLHTAVGQVLALDNNMLPSLVDTEDFILRQDEALIIQVVAGAGSSNPATNHYFIEVVWEEN